MQILKTASTIDLVRCGLILIGGNTMRGIPSLITDIRKNVFTEVARMAYSGRGYEGVDDLPYIIVPGDQPLHRESVFL